MNSQKDKNKIIGELKRLIGIIFLPKTTLRNIISKPTWFMPLLIIIIVQIAFYILTIDIQKKDEIEKMRIWGMSEERIERVQSQINSPNKYYTIPTIPINLIINLSISVFIYLFLFKLLLKKELKFNSVFSTVVWCSIVGLSSKSIIYLVIILLKNTAYSINISLALFLPKPTINEKLPILYQILSKFDFFTIWQYVLLIMAFNILCEIPRKQYIILIFIVFLPMILIIFLNLFFHLIY